jgi:hypothetical protein
MQDRGDLHFQVLAYCVTLRIHSRPGQRLKRSEAISVDRFHSVPPTSPGFGYKESGSRAAISSNTARGMNGNAAIRSFSLES